MQVRLYMKADKAISSLEFFTTHQWRFISDNPIHLLEEMTTKDREMFYFDVRNINWQSYLENYILGIRQFTLKDDPTTLPAARTNLKRYRLHLICIASFFSYVFQPFQIVPSVYTLPLYLVFF
jgi:fatty acyl-CoA reductase